jgi:hypothetical protein
VFSFEGQNMTRSLAKIISVLVSTTLLAACGGGSGTLMSAGSSFVSGAGPTGSSGSAGPGTTPATDAYKTYDELAGDQSFVGSFASTQSKGLPRYQGALGGGSNSITYTAATNSYTVQYFGYAPEAFRIGYDPVAGKTLTIEQFGAPGTLRYTRFLQLSRDKDFNDDIVRATFGVPTRTNDTPLGKATYKQVGFVGNAVRKEGDVGVQYGLANSLLDLSVDFAAETLQMRLALIGTPVGGGADTALGTYVSSGTDYGLLQGNANLNGILKREGQTEVVGGYQGSFFGPQAAEYGLTFRITDGVNQPTLVAGGAVGGRKQ